MDDVVKYSVIVATVGADTWTVTSYDGGQKPIVKIFRSKIGAESHASAERKRLGIGS
ncbi:hypothetical protein [Rhizobium sp. BG4]|uniref:hypothetical protein n=1 Tax=Rhizobium sp. BG4 TaxID=2613770 RepID=UPI00193CCE91|nr:hypothetical protein [Rhizobium sp. BG4]